MNEMQMRCSKRSRRRRNPSISLSVLLLLLCYTLHGRCLSQRMPSSLYRPPSSSATGLFRSPPTPHTPFPPRRGSVSGRRWKEKEGKGRTDGGAPSPPPSSGRSPVIRQRTLLLHLASPPPAHVPPSFVSVAPPSLPRRCCVFSSHVHTGGRELLLCYTWRHACEIVRGCSPLPHLASPAGCRRDTRVDYGTLHSPK